MKWLLPVLEVHIQLLVVHEKLPSEVLQHHLGEVEQDLHGALHRIKAVLKDIARPSPDQD